MATLRRATVDDAPDLVRLRRLMYEAMGKDASDDGWVALCEDALRRRIPQQDRFCAYVVEVDGLVVSGGVGWMEEHLPSPGQFDGRRGHIANMSTEPGYRRQGHGRQVLGALMDWFASHDVPRVDLRATPDGRPLYERSGFRVLGGATMAWTREGYRVGMPGS